MLQVIELPLQRIQTLNLQDRSLKILSCSNSLNSDNLGYSEVVIVDFDAAANCLLFFDNESTEPSRRYPLISI